MSGIDLSRPDAGELKRLLGALLEGSIEPADLTRLVQLSRVIVQVHLRSKHSSIPALYQFHGISESDLAYDSIGEVFIAREQRVYPKVRRFAESLGREFASVDAAEIFVAWRGLLLRIAEAHIAHLYALADPEGGRIYRNIREHLRNSNPLAIRRLSAGLMIHPAGSDPPNGFTPVPRERLERECLGRRAEIRDTRDFLRILHEVLMGAGVSSPAVLMHDAVQVMKLVNSDGHLAALFQGSPPDLTGFTPDDIERIRAEVLYKVKEKIVVTYITRGKLSRSEGEDLFAAVAAVVKEWCDGLREERSLFEYLRMRRNVDATAYAARYRAKLEYLVKLAREECEAWLLGEL